MLRGCTRRASRARTWRLGNAESAMHVPFCGKARAMCCQSKFVTRCLTKPAQPEQPLCPAHKNVAPFVRESTCSVARKRKSQIACLCSAALRKCRCPSCSANAHVACQEIDVDESSVFRIRTDHVASANAPCCPCGEYAQIKLRGAARTQVSVVLREFTCRVSSA